MLKDKETLRVRHTVFDDKRLYFLLERKHEGKTYSEGRWVSSLEVMTNRALNPAYVLYYIILGLQNGIELQLILQDMKK
jgi:hypothetical protein